MINMLLLQLVVLLLLCALPPSKACIVTNRVHARRTCQQLVSKQHKKNHENQRTDGIQQISGNKRRAEGKQQQLDQQTNSTTQAVAALLRVCLWNMINKNQMLERKIARKLQINKGKI
uniref:Secreted protein n=1 Tax=Ceratitis capitata TaxID=7213 RepID=W8BTJ1_CERCA